MEPFLAVLGFVLVAVISPGPNNFVVLTAAAHGGVKAAVPAIFGVVVGSLALVGLVWIGADALFRVLPGLRHALLAVGTLYLGWLGAVLVWRAGRRRPAPVRTGPEDLGTGLPRTALGLGAFQLFNPKAWVLALTATTALLGVAEPGPALLALLVLFSVVPCLCLLLWALLGAAISGALRRPQVRRVFDGAMGVLLVGSALLLVF